MCNPLHKRVSAQSEANLSLFDDGVPLETLGLGCIMLTAPLLTLLQYPLGCAKGA